MRFLLTFRPDIPLKSKSKCLYNVVLYMYREELFLNADSCINIRINIYIKNNSKEELILYIKGFQLCAITFKAL